MPFSKAETVLFDDILTGFEPNNLTAKNVTLFSPAMKEFERSGLQVQRPMPYNSRTQSGIDQTGNFGDVTQLSVPSALRESDIVSIPFTLSGTDLNDPRRMKDKARSSVISLSAALDGQVAREAANKGSLVVTRPNQIEAYLDGALCEAKMQEQDINIATERCLIFNPRDAAHVSSNIANRAASIDGKVMSAYERSALNSIGGFETLRASFNPTITAAAGGAITVAAVANHVPTATNAAGDNVDNRYMNLTVSATANVKVGDAFNIAGVNALSHIHKEDTGELKDFRVVEVVNGTTLKITPAIIVNTGATLPEREYANVTAPAASGAAITWRNTTTARANTFFTKDSMEIIHGRLPGSEYSGMDVMREVTDSGIEILFAKQTSIDNLKTKYRLDMWARGHCLNTEMAGILLGNQ